MSHVVTNIDHEPLANDEYNFIQKANFRAEFRKEADFILEEQSNGMYLLAKNPDEYTGPSTIADGMKFAVNHDKVFIERLNGTYERFNFDSGTDEVVVEAIEDEVIEDATTSAENAEEDTSEQSEVNETF